MDPRLKQRLVGAAVLVALAVIFLPMLVQGPAPDSGAASVPLAIPPAPRDDFQTQELPLVTPGDAPAGGALGMDAPVPAAPDATAPSPDAATLSPDAAELATPATSVAPAPAQPVAPAVATPDAAPLFAATAGGDYAVSFGAYASVAAAERVLGSVRSAGLPAYREATTSGGKPAWRVRIGPFATRAEAESARLRANHVRDDVGARVVVLDADAAQPATAAPSKPVATERKPANAPKQVAAVAPKPATAPAAAGVGFAVQLAAYSKAADANALRDRLRAAGFSAFTETVNTDKGALVRVRVGPVADRAAAEQLRAQVKAKLGLDGMVRPHP
ncbi:MAG TPA: SPOR domain-containing protein [Xanthomonadaceae bacterium]|nr:SPOR domain-containing protein [Xanthomonadaceae bacterium]